MASLPPVGTQRVINDVVSILRGEIIAEYSGPLVNGQWRVFGGLPRLQLTGTGTVSIDARDSGGTISTAVQSYNVTNAVDRIEYPYFGETAVEIRANITGTLSVEII